MAFTNFYLIGGGTGSADINAGSSIGAAQATTTNGSWNSGTGVFIAASGTPFAATVVGDYASLYVDGATVTTFVAKVTVVTSNVNITVDVATIKYGTAPSTSATGRSCTINGSWSTEQVLAAGGMATTTVPQSTKVNIKFATYTVTASRTITIAAATTLPLWFSGYNTTPGDLDNDTTNSLAKPIFALGNTFVLTTSGTSQIWSSISITGSRSGAIWVATSGTGLYIRMRAENTSSNAAAVAVTIGVGNAFYCWFKCPTTATTTGTVNFGNNTALCVGCVSEGGGLAAFNIQSNSVTLVQCVALSPTGAGFLATTALMRVMNCTVYAATGDGVKWSSTPTPLSCVTSSLFAGCGGYGINNGSGANTGNVSRACNDFYACSSGDENGFGDFPDFFRKDEVASPFVNAPTDLTLAAAALARQNGFPGVFENEAYSSFLSCGAVAPTSASTGGGGAVFIFGG